MSDIDTKSGELTHKVIRRGIHPLLCPPSPTFPIWKPDQMKGKLCLLPDLSNFGNEDHPDFIFLQLLEVKLKRLPQALQHLLRTAWP